MKNLNKVKSEKGVIKITQKEFYKILLTERPSIDKKVDLLLERLQLFKKDISDTTIQARADLKRL